MMRILVVVGVRPHFMKLSVLLPQLETAHEVTTAHTGQHFDRVLSGAFFDELGLPEPTRRYDVGSGSHAIQTGRAMQAVEEAAIELKPDLVVVIGDANTTLAGALAAAKLGIPVAHIEAGTRSFDRALPEEINRLAIDAVASLHLCTSERSRRQLVTEGHVDTAVVVGDLLLDAIDQRRDAMRTAGHRLRAEIPVLGSAALVTVHRAATVRDSYALNAVVEGVSHLGRPALCVLHPATRHALIGSGLLDELLAAPGVRVLDALSHTDLLALVSAADRVLTDSNGVQREALFLGTPCFVLRDSTEFRESVDLGAARLVGTDPLRIAAAGTDQLDMPTPEAVREQFGAGRAAERVFAAIDRAF